MFDYQISILRTGTVAVKTAGGLWRLSLSVTKFLIVGLRTTVHQIQTSPDSSEGT